MGVRDVLRSIELRAVKISDEEFCPHLPPIVFYPNGSEENEQPEHACGLPRLKFTIAYADGSDIGSRARQLRAARVCFLQSAELFPDEPEEVRAAEIAAAYGITVEEVVTPPTRSSL